VQPARQGVIPGQQQTACCIWQAAELLVLEVPVPVAAVPQLQGKEGQQPTASSG
jgi:hypothetical protein